MKVILSHEPGEATIEAEFWPDGTLILSMSSYVAEDREIQLTPSQLKELKLALAIMEDQS